MENPFEQAMPYMFTEITEMPFMTPTAAETFTVMPTTPSAAWDMPDSGDMLPVMAYVPVQRINHSDSVYEPEVAFGIGTLFPTLHKPWRVGYE